MDALREIAVLDRIAVFLAADARLGLEILGDALVRHVLQSSRLGSSNLGEGMLPSLLKHFELGGGNLPVDRSHLHPREWAILLLLQGGDHTFSYLNVGIKMGLDGAEVPVLLHSARMKVAWSERLDYPRWSQVQGLECPELQSRAPWMQRLMDEEMAPSEQRLFTMHLTQCPLCMDRMNRYRKFHSMIGNWIRAKQNQIESRADSKGFSQKERLKTYQKWIREGVRLTRGIRIELR